MFVIHKKRLKIIISCILISLLAFSFKIAENQEQTQNNSTKTVETTSTPVSRKNSSTRCWTWQTR